MTPALLSKITAWELKYYVLLAVHNPAAPTARYTVMICCTHMWGSADWMLQNAVGFYVTAWVDRGQRGEQITGIEELQRL